ncbi:hypothetical protein MMSR116_29370 [Methylobacterium mesophilicum SR1.6/6]|uniref:Uncharacterized protein n=1 Tax=Methylobacterium mesophilicum SR1.6/6 TaxID=908290 RepID=A0A6B9FSZ3_9HYPH|nr:hypothetical protein [Methylobacterium mesophilicum]QGY05547.1 hypothetical protein MMSR116_29370 [Methylobacterium mesophilicum SR1.6/6]
MAAASMFGGLPLAHAPIASIPALTHYGADPVRRVYSVAQRPEPHFKPYGLWVSADAGSFSWPDYVEAEAGDHLYRLRVVHDVQPAAGARILLIATVDDFDAFAGQYGRTERFVPSDYLMYIDWKAVAEAYRYDRRFDGGLWYYGWDCASGCIWDADAIAAITVRSPAREVA